MLEHDVDWVMVVGVAGGVDHSIEIGSVIVPEVVVDRATGGRFRPPPAGDIEPRGILSCGDDLITDAGRIAAMEADGVVAVDMETAAVAAVCARHDVPWSVFRGISDFADGGLVDDAMFALTRPDGTADPDAIARYLDANPDRRRVLEQLAHDADWPRAPPPTPPPARSTASATGADAMPEPVHVHPPHELSESSEATTRRERILEILSALLLSLATVGIAWSGYQAARWSGLQAEAYTQASTARSLANQNSTIAARAADPGPPELQPLARGAVGRARPTSRRSTSAASGASSGPRSKNGSRGIR